MSSNLDEGVFPLRTVMKRARAQASILAVVTLVALFSCTLLSGLAVLATASERFAVTEALAEAPASSTEVFIGLNLWGEPLGPADTAVSDGLTGLFGSVPVRTTRQVASEVEPVRGTNLERLMYYGAYDGMATQARLVQGRWPTAAATARAAAGGGRIPVAVPRQLARHLHLDVGDTLTSEDVESNEPTRGVVVGVYTTTPAAATGTAGTDPDAATQQGFWDFDTLSGKGHAEDWPVPGLPGLSADAYGPVVVDRSAFTELILPTEAQTRAVPDLARLPHDQLGTLLERARAAEKSLSIELDSVSTSPQVVTSLGDTLDRINRYLFVTRSGVVVTALLLLVLSTAALLLAARLLAERRTTEQALMRARGASGRQLLRLAALEGVILAVGTALAAPPLARLLYLVIADRPAFAAAGLDHDPGVPGVARVVAAATSVLFLLVLLTPLLRRSTTFVEHEQERSRQDRRGLLQRSGLDLALVVLAGVAYWQLRTYRSPLLAADGELRLDPVLVTGPALCLLAGALLAMRFVPLLSRLAERTAARGRAVVLPLAAWEIGRRPARATGAVLLLTLALSSGTFGLSYLATWRASQQDQADFTVGTDVRIQQLTSSALGQSRAVSAVPGATTCPRCSTGR